MQIVIMVDGKNWNTLTEEEKNYYRVRLNDQALRTAGYVRDEESTSKNRVCV